jgi:hypothetical protein
MGRRGSNSFRRNDGLRAIRVARDGGIEPSGLEVIVAPDGTTTFRVLGDNAAQMRTSESHGAKLWEDEIQKLKPKAPKRR